MLQLSIETNRLTELVRNENLKPSNCNLSLNYLSVNYMYSYTYGAYQLKQAPGYYTDHIIIAIIK
ncbi:hypothetical protein WH47_02422 [Habropoda laboriosa]|uniref:Uncharacterized protein n=1 Tax=Habropoda laboriosa TaxID=597456 RepID=A0A0L7RKC1_9HYME|nr:hypothetical protein WH47_02422 [Habropoda laboriosa]